MSGKLSGPMALNLAKGEMVCAAGEQDNDLYIIHTGKLMVYVLKGSQVIPVAYIGEGEYMGELSFFDGESRSACVVCMEDSTLIKIPVQEIDKQFPRWLLSLAQNMTKQIRSLDEIVRAKGIRKKNVETIKPLSIEEQREYFKIYSTYMKSRGANA